MLSKLTDQWDNGDPYEYFMGRWSSKMAPVFLDWLNAESNLKWADVGCGTGALSAAIHAQNHPSSIICIDPSEAFLQQAQKRLGDDCNVLKAGADKIPLANSSLDVIASGLALNFFPDPKAALSEFKRILKQKGNIGIYIWDYSGKMEMLRYFWDAAKQIDPTAAELDEGVRFPICNEQSLSTLFKEAGFTDIETESLDITTTFFDFDDYWNPFLGQQGPAPGFVNNLNPEKQNALRKLLMKTLPMNADDTISLTARAIALKAVN